MVRLIKSNKVTNNLKNMPTQNPYLIKENYKKIEEVKEIDYQVPSYEEFMKNYEIDKKVSDNYENEFDSKNGVAVPYRYGPGNEQSKQQTANVITGALLTGLTAVCPPAGAAVGGGMAVAGAVTIAATDGDDKHDEFARNLG